MSRIPIKNINDVEYESWGDGGRFEAQLGALAAPLGAKKLGYKMVKLASGKTGWPFHFHHANEEMFLILEGKGVLRYGDKMYSVKPGDVISCPPGEEGAHQLTNTSAEDMRYLAVSTMESPEICEYPDSGKFGAYVGQGDDKLEMIAEKESMVGYWTKES